MSSYQRTNKESVVFMEMVYGSPLDPSYINICSAFSNQSVDGKEWLGEPALDLEISEDTGAMEEKPTTIRLPRAANRHPTLDTFLDLITSPIPFSETHVTIFEIQQIANPSPQQNPQDRTYLKEGKIRLSRRNPDGNPDVIELEIIPEKNQAENVRLGIQATAQCTHTFGKEGCYLDVSGFYPADMSTIASLNWTGTRFQFRANMVVEMSMFVANQRTQIVSLSPSSTTYTNIPADIIEGQPIGWWLGSFLERDGLSIPIRDWLWQGSTGTNLFVLGKVPPISWEYVASDDNTLTLSLGCLNIVEACKQRDNEIHFGGAGYGMPAYNPLIDQDNR